MIGRLAGRVVEINGAVVLIDVNGVGYEVEVTTQTLAAVATGDGPVVLYTHLVVREDAHALFGFSQASERDLFRALIKINGVGPKLAVTLLSALAPGELARCVGDGDIATITKVPGVGKKTAERLVVELKDRLDVIPAAAGAPAAPPRTEAAAEAETALIGLGYRPAEARRVVEQVYADDRSTQELIRAALRRMGSVESTA